MSKLGPEKAAIVAERLARLSPWVPVTAEQWEQGPIRLREALCSVPFYAKRAAQEKAKSGDEMVYWRDLFRSAPHMTRPPLSPAKADGEQAGEAKKDDLGTGNDAGDAA